MIAELTQLLGPPNVLAEKEDLIPYSFDGTAVLKQLPRVVVFPRHAQDVSAVLKLAHTHRAPVVTRGSGTGLSGGSVPVEGAIVLCLVKMDKILELDPRNFTLRAEAGVVTQKIYETADAAGLFYPPDPSSMKISTIGGNVANNSGGLRGLKYGITRNYVMGLEIVLPNGEIMTTGNKCVKDVAGYNLRDLFIGSEGTLGVITQVLLKLLAQTRRAANAARHLRADGCRRRRDGLRHHRGENHPMHAGVSRPQDHPLRRGLRPCRAADRRGSAAPDRDRRASGGRGGRGGPDRENRWPRASAPPR